MKIQKPTVLDAARIASELERFKGAIIDQALMDSGLSSLHLKLRKPDAVLKIVVEKRYAYMGLAASVANERPVRALIGYEIAGASQFEDDRIVKLQLERKDRLGRKQNAALIFELIPNKGDVILVDDNDNIKWSLRKKDGAYMPPPKLKKATVLNFEMAQISSGIEKPQQIADAIYGLSERDLINLRLDDYSTVESALEAIRLYANKAVEPGPAWVVYNDDQIAGYSLLSPALQDGESAKKLPSALEMYEAYYSQSAGEETEQDRLESLRRMLVKEISRERGKLSSIQKELENAESSGTYRKYGEMILAHIDSIKRGASLASLTDFESGEPVDIKLDPAKSAAANAEEYFKRARKAASSVNVLTARFESTKKRLALLDDVKTGNIETLESELIRLNLLSTRTGPPKRKLVEPRLPYKRYRASSGWEIWVGRTNKDNDELTFKIAHKDDYWFHAWQSAGSHTVLRLPNKNAVPDKQTLLEAASLAAYFSKARTSSKVPVAYTQVRFVHKPRNFPPGKVLVDKEKQLIVKPADPDRYMIQDE